MSCNVLGLMYETGAGGIQDLGRAAGLYRRACDRGITAGCIRLELIRRSEPPVQLADGSRRFGWVADSETGAPIGEAIVDVPRLGLRAVADEAGRVPLGRLPRGRHVIVAQRTGYEALRGELPVPWDTEFLILLEATALPDPTALGRLFGRVTEPGGVDGLADVEIAVEGSTPTRVLSDAQGRFTLTGLEPGPVELRFTRLGYAPRTTTLTVQPGRTVEVHLSMSVRPIELEPIQVLVGSGYLERNGFYRRARSARGRRFTHPDIESIAPRLLSDLFWRTPGVTVQQGQRGARIVSSRPSFSTGDGRPCPLRPYLDGIPMFDWDPDLVLPGDLEGVEVYQGSGTPIEYRNLLDPDGTSPCGVLLIWTRRGN
ncbi:MAG: carboxypeptidase regulatory-like domain-containing protein [Gemmatimonadota bacterium]|nr:carboxypeptidase regulatory-like domain-containing protein [Gemmatimonadota bacterium]